MCCKHKPQSVWVFCVLFTSFVTCMQFLIIIHIIGPTAQYRASFVYHGFRYIRVDNFPSGFGTPTLVGLFLHSDVNQHGTVNVDSSTIDGRVLNSIHSSVVQTQSCNLYSIPTDCPQREKRGWMGDAQWTVSFSHKTLKNISRICSSCYLFHTRICDSFLHMLSTVCWNNRQLLLLRLVWSPFRQ